jgi:hypothetical protein
MVDYLAWRFAGSLQTGKGLLYLEILLAFIIILSKMHSE